MEQLTGEKYNMDKSTINISEISGTFPALIS
jgi:hypothetical protein